VTDIFPSANKLANEEIVSNGIAAFSHENNGANSNALQISIVVPFCCEMRRSARSAQS
jgi:hypothetical protein